MIPKKRPEIRLSTRSYTGPAAKKSLGQNFLVDGNIATKIVRLLEVAPDDAVLEIGPGQGALTGRIIEQRPARLTLVEKDAHWARALKERFPRTHVVLADALRMPWERMMDPWKCIGNLPYNVASPLIWDIVSLSPGLSRAVFMVQKEVGLRLTAQPGSSAFGALSVWVQSFVKPTLEHIVPPHVFRPRPKIDSAVVSFVPWRIIQDMGATASNGVPENLATVLKECFQMRRKQLGTIVRTWSKGPEFLQSLSLDPKLRPENLSVNDFHRLAMARHHHKAVDSTG